jgi:hypothetical protein
MSEPLLVEQTILRQMAEIKKLRADLKKLKPVARIRRQNRTQQEEIKRLRAVAAMLSAVVQGAQEEFVRVPYGASHEDVAQINDWHEMAKEAQEEFASLDAAKERKDA